jgi:hypothetical protein
MCKKLRHAWESFVMLSIGVFMLAMTGCSPKTDLPPQNTPKQETNKKDELQSTVEILSENPSAHSRKIFTSLSGSVAEIHTLYKNGDTGIQYLDQLTELPKECKELFSDGKLKSHVVYDKDGKTVLKGELYRPDGSLRHTRERLSQGNYKTSYFLPNAKYPFRTDEPIGDGVVERTILRTDGSLWAKVTIRTIKNPALPENMPQRQAIEQSIYFTAQSKIERKVIYAPPLNHYTPGEPGPGPAIAEWYREDGTIEFVQTWTANDFYSLDSVQEYEADGKTIKRLIEISEIEVPPTAQDLADGRLYPVRLVQPRKVIGYKNGVEIYTKDLVRDDVYNVNLEYNPDLQVLNPEFASVNPVIRNRNLMPERVFENMPVLLEDKSADKVYEHFDLKPFQFPRDPGLDTAAMDLMTDFMDRNYYGQPMPVYDPCRTWYSTVVF